MKYDETNLKEVLEAHKRWVNASEGWTEDDRANLSWANLSGANLSRADLRGAYLYGAKNVPYIPVACPSDGAFVGWKKAYLMSGATAIVKLLIPENARRSSATGSKCRCEKAEVLEIWSLDAETKELKDQYTEARSIHDRGFVYRVGETVTPKEPFCEDRFNECASGIHFFIDRQAAINY